MTLKSWWREWCGVYEYEATFKVGDDIILRRFHCKGNQLQDRLISLVAQMCWETQSVVRAELILLKDLTHGHSHPGVVADVDFITAMDKFPNE